MDKIIKAAQECRIISNERVNGAIYKLTFEFGKQPAATVAPGQFVMLKCGGGAYLRRPFSICDIPDEAGAATIMYRLTGAGTQAVSLLRAGGTLDIIGPLGKGFDVLPDKAAVVGGGIGLFPLILLARRLCEGDGAPDIFVGFRNNGSVVLEHELACFSKSLTIVSDDGSVGVKGFVTEAFEKALVRGEKYSVVYACGPVPMLVVLKGICEKFGVYAQFSVEERMGCGIGACLVCACAVKLSGGAGGGSDTDAGSETYTYVRACRDGPVFSAEDLMIGR